MIREESAMRPPEWAAYVKTGVHKERAPSSKDWWYLRAAAMLRKIYLHGPMGVERISAQFGGKRDRGSAPYHARKGSGAIARRCLQALEKCGYISMAGKKGRVITSKGRALLDRCAHETLKQMAETDRSLVKYL